MLDTHRFAIVRENRETYEIIWVTEEDGPVVSDKLVELHVSESVSSIFGFLSKGLTLILPAVVLAYAWSASLPPTLVSIPIG